MTQARALYQLQSIELEMLDRAKRVKSISGELADDQNLRAASKDLKAAQARLGEYRKSMAALERQIDAVAAKREATETRLYSGSVTNPKEMQDMQQEMGSLARRRDQLDDELLILMLELDDAGEAAEAKSQAVAEIQAGLRERDARLKRERDQLNGELDELRAARKTALADVAEPELRAYNKLRAEKANRPVAELRERNCAACGIGQDQSIIAALNRNEALVYCGSCGRILCRA